MAQSYIWPLPHAFEPGSLLRIRGAITKDGKRFDVNLQNEFEYTKSELMLHTSFRYSDGTGFIVNNSKDHSGWMVEEMRRNIDFEPGVSFELLILCTFDKFQIALNGNHISDFTHRLPYSSVKCLGVKGEVMLTLISLEDSNNPERPVIGTHYPLLSDPRRR